MISHTRRAVFLVEAGPHWGYGHLRRCLILARALKKMGFECKFGIFGSDEVVQKEFSAEYLSAGILPELSELSNSAVIVDGYHFDGDCFQLLRANAGLLVRIDDLADQPVECDLLINQNIYAAQLDYSRYDFGEILLGADYALIDSAFHDLRDVTGKPRDVVVSLGGGQTAMLAMDLIEDLAEAGAEHIHVALGNNPVPINAPTRCGSAVVSYYPHAVIPDLLRLSAVAVSSIGTSTLEILASGRDLIGVMVANNQILNYRALVKLGVPVFKADEGAKVGQAYCRVLHGHGVSLQAISPDGEGPSRVATAILQNCTLR